MALAWFGVLGTGCGPGRRVFPPPWDGWDSRYGRTRTRCGTRLFHMAGLLEPEVFWNLQTEFLEKQKSKTKLFSQNEFGQKPIEKPR